MSPSMLKTPSVMTRMCSVGARRSALGACLAQDRSRPSTSLCGKTARAALESRTPSMIEAWLSSSLTIRSPSSVMVGMTPLLAVKPDWKVSVASACLKAARRRSSSSCSSMVPAIVRTAPLPDAELADRRERRLDQVRVRGQAEVVVGREADHPPAVHDRVRRLRPAHDAQRPVERLPRAGPRCASPR